MKDSELREIYFAGGCFWGVQEYFARIPGVGRATSGYANSTVERPSYEQVCSGSTGAAEAVRVAYDPAKVSLSALVRQYFRIVDPLSLNRQGNDIGTQYRTGVYYTHAAERELLEKLFAAEARKHDRPLAVELRPLENFWPAESYHQDYLKNNPDGYCHIDFSGLRQLEQDSSLVDPSGFAKQDKGSLKKSLSPEEYHVTMESGTEPPFSGKYWNNYARGIYVDVATGEPLFVSSQKFDSGCGWPSFASPIAPDVVKEKTDLSHGMSRVEVRSRVGDSHLGHVFDDGPKALGGLRYCINSAALRFIPYEKMEEEGYGEWLPLVKQAH